MTEDFTGTLSAFVDGETIDPDRLAAALEDPGARAAVVDFVRMRAVVRAGDQPLPASLGTFRRPPVGGLRLLRWPAVAALLVLVFLAGLAAPRPWQTAPEPSSETPPAPARIEKFTPGVDWHQSN
jgi:hypothetical protein